MPAQTRLHLAVLAYSPGGVAQHFSRMVGQFSCRADFDAFARRARDLYGHMSPKHALRFAMVLDDGLRARGEEPVAWAAASE